LDRKMLLFFLKTRNVIASPIVTFNGDKASVAVS
jgi:hypothetical protein